MSLLCKKAYRKLNLEKDTGVFSFFFSFSSFFCSTGPDSCFWEFHPSYHVTVILIFNILGLAWLNVYIRITGSHIMHMYYILISCVYIEYNNSCSESFKAQVNCFDMYLYTVCTQCIT